MQIKLLKLMKVRKNNTLYDHITPVLDFATLCDLFRKKICYLVIRLKPLIITLKPFHLVSWLSSKAQDEGARDKRAADGAAPATLSR